MPVLVARPLRPGPRRRDDPADRLRRDRPDPARVAAAADVRDAVDRLGPARRHRAGDRRRRSARRSAGGSSSSASCRSSRSPARSRSGRCARSAPRRPTRRRDGRRRGAPRSPAAGHRRSPSAPGSPDVGLTTRRAASRRSSLERRSASLIGVSALRRLTPPGTLTARPVLPAAVLLRGHPDLRLLRRRRLRRADPRRLARPVGDRGRDRPDRRDRRLDRRRLDPGARRLALADPRGSSRSASRSPSIGPGRDAPRPAPGRPVAGRDRRLRRRPASGWAWPTRRWRSSSCARRRPTSQGAATSALSLTDSLGTALGTGIAGAIVAASVRPTGEPVAGLAAGFIVARRDRPRRARC